MARYKMRQKMFSIGEDFTIEDAAGNPAFEVDGKVMTLRETFELKDRQGNVVAAIRGKLLRRGSGWRIRRPPRWATTCAVRLRHARHLLSTTDRPLAAISSDADFSDASHLCRTFPRRMR
jgi:uncharacterized protein YxjI